MSGVRRGFKNHEQDQPSAGSVPKRRERAGRFESRKQELERGQDHMARGQWGSCWREVEAGNGAHGADS